MVTATRLPTDLIDLPFAAGVVTGQEVQRGRQQLGLDEALEREPGLFFQNRYNFAQDLRIAIRGFGVRAPVVFYNRSNEAAQQLKEVRDEMKDTEGKPEVTDLIADDGSGMGEQDLSLRQGGVRRARQFLGCTFEQFTHAAHAVHSIQSAPRAASCSA